MPRNVLPVAPGDAIAGLGSILNSERTSLNSPALRFTIIPCKKISYPIAVIQIFVYLHRDWPK
jgi:hypothetical protein